MKPWWLYQDASVSRVVIYYEGIPPEFVEELSDSEPVIFPSLCVSVADFLNKHVPLLLDTSTVPLSWLARETSAVPIARASPCFTAPFSGNHSPIFYKPAPPKMLSHFASIFYVLVSLLEPILKTWLHVIVCQGEWREAKAWLEQCTFS